MNFLRRSLMGLFLLAMTLALLGLAFYTVRGAVEERMGREDSSPDVRERVYSVDFVEVTPRTVAPVTTAFGEVRARRELQVRAQTGGTIIALGDGFEEGGRVEAGQLLVRIDPTELAAAVAVVEADIAETQTEITDAKAALAIARDDLDNTVQQRELRNQALQRQRDLLSRGVGTEAAVETTELTLATADQAVLMRRSSLASAEARVARANTTLSRLEINLDEARRRLRETEVFAAFSGRLTGVSALEGGVVSANEQLATLIDPDVLEVSFRLSTSQYARLLDETGALIPAEVAIRLAVAGVDLVVPGRIDRESAAVGDGQTGRLLFARFENAQGFRPGDFVTIEVAEPEMRGVAVIPSSAIGNAGTVLALGANDDNVLIEAGALAGRRIVAARTPVLGAGIRVRTTSDDVAPGARPDSQTGE